MVREVVEKSQVRALMKGVSEFMCQEFMGRREAVLLLSLVLMVVAMSVHACAGLKSDVPQSTAAS